MSALACPRRRRWSTARIRSAPADDAHSQGADLVLDKVAGGAWLLDRQRDRPGEQHRDRNARNAALDRNKVNCEPARGRRPLCVVAPTYELLLPMTKA
jgi:hypothetical protein